MGFNKYLSWNTPSWSIGAEWWAYVLFPFILAPFKKIITWRRPVVLFFIIIGYLFVIYYLHPLSVVASPFHNNAIGIYSLNVTHDYGFIRCFSGFLFGMLIYDKVGL